MAVEADAIQNIHYIIVCHARRSLARSFATLAAAAVNPTAAFAFHSISLLGASIQYTHKNPPELWRCINYTDFVILNVTWQIFWEDFWDCMDRLKALFPGSSYNINLVL